MHLDERHALRLKHTRDYVGCVRAIRQLSVGLVVSGMIVGAVTVVALIVTREDLDFIATILAMKAPQTMAAAWTALAVALVALLVGVLGLVRPIFRLLGPLAAAACGLGLIGVVAVWLLRDSGPPFSKDPNRPLLGYLTAALYAVNVLIAISGVLVRNLCVILRRALEDHGGKPSETLIGDLAALHRTLIAVDPRTTSGVIILSVGARQFTMLLGSVHCIVARKGGKSLAFVSVQDMKLQTGSGARNTDGPLGPGRLAQVDIGKGYSTTLFGVEAYIEDQRFGRLLACAIGLGSSALIYRGEAHIANPSLARLKQWRGQ